MSESESRSLNEKLVALNVRHRAFYDRQVRLLEERVADPALRDAAFRSLASEQMRQVPIYSQKPLELALQEAQCDRNEFRRQVQELQDPVTRRAQQAYPIYGKWQTQKEQQAWGACGSAGQ